MLKKKLNFDANVLEVIKNLNWSSNGSEAKIEQQLDRNMYTKVNKALEAMGGKWNRSTKAHMFPEDPRDQVEGLLKTGVIEIDRDGFYPTPDAIINRMFEIMPVNCEAFILEPSCGNGAILKRLLSQGVSRDNIIAIEINEKRAKQTELDLNLDISCSDFMTWPKYELWFDQIYMNPPFENCQDMDHVMKACECLQVGGELISVMSQHMLFANDTKSIIFREFLRCVEHRVITLPSNSFKTSGTNVNAILVHIKME